MTVIRWLTFRRPLCHPAPSRWAVPTAAEEPQIFSPTHPSYLSTASECVIPRCANTGEKAAERRSVCCLCRVCWYSLLLLLLLFPITSLNERSTRLLGLIFFFLTLEWNTLCHCISFFKSSGYIKIKKVSDTHLFYFFPCVFLQCAKSDQWAVHPAAKLHPHSDHTHCAQQQQCLGRWDHTHTHTLYLANAVQAWCFISWFRKCPEAQRPPDNNNIQWVLTLKDRPSRNDRATSLQSVLSHTRGVWWCRATLQLL